MLPTGLEKYCCPPGDGLAAARMIEGIMQLLGDVGGERPRSPHSSGPEAWKAGGKAIPRTGLKERTIRCCCAGADCCIGHTIRNGDSTGSLAKPGKLTGEDWRLTDTLGGDRLLATGSVINI